MQMTTIDYNVQHALDYLQQFGLSSASMQLRMVYSATMDNLDELSRLSAFYLAGGVFALMSFEHIPNTPKAPNLAYYCLTRAVTANQPSHDIWAQAANRQNAIAERAKLLLNGAVRLITDRIDAIHTMPAQQAYDLSILGDIMYLRNDGFTSGEIWWVHANEDYPRIRASYSHLSDDEIMTLSQEVHETIADRVLSGLKEFPY